MKTKRFQMIPLRAILCLVILFFAATPTWANNDPTVSIYNSNTATENNGVMISGIGAIAVGNNNTAIGIAGQYIVFQNGANSDGVSLSPAGLQLNQGPSGNTWDTGAVAVGTNNTALGTGASAQGYGNTAIGKGATAEGNNRVAIGAGSVAYEDNTVSVGKYGEERRITNVAPGIYDTDAVNMSQLRSVDNKVNRVGSIAMAMSGLAPLAYDPKDPTQYSAAYGTYNGVGAVALGVFHYTKPTIMYNMAIAMSDDKWEKAARFGVTWRTGGPKPKVLTPTVAKAQDEETIESGVKIILPERMPKK